MLAASFASTASAQHTLSPGCREPVDLVRVHGDTPVERVRMRLVDCDGRPIGTALIELSVLARPYDVDPPEERADGREIAPGIVRLDAGLVTRLQAIADRFAGREIHIVSGYRRSARTSSRHRQGRALDLRVDGIAREDVVALARTFDATGVGYYPNSTFTHIDVRDRSFYWVDRSAPGERARYVLRTSDPDAPMLPPEPEHDAREPVREPAPVATDATTAACEGPSCAARTGEARDGEDEHEDPLTPAEVEAFRLDVRAQLRAFRERVLGTHDR
jgi:hypothetical protein